MQAVQRSPWCGTLASHRGWPEPAAYTSRMIAASPQSPRSWAHWSPTAHVTGNRPRFSRPVPVVLVVLALATLLMPVNYRAGADTSHPHTILQGLVDVIVGEPHRHDPGESGPPRPVVSPFAPVTAPLDLLASTAASEAASAAEPDVPVMLGMSMPISSMSAIAALALLLAALLAGTGIVPPWTIAQALRARGPAQEPPPPRLAHG